MKTFMITYKHAQISRVLPEHAVETCSGGVKWPKKAV